MITWFKNLFKKKEAPLSWGEKKVLIELPHLKVTHLWVDSNKSTETYTTQELTSKLWLILKGNGEYQNGFMRKKIIPGTNAMISNGTKHCIMAGGDRVEVLEIQYGEAVVTPTLQLPASTKVSPVEAASDSQKNQ